MGNAVGKLLGKKDGFGVGLPPAYDGTRVGVVVGTTDGAPDGGSVGMSVGPVGLKVGDDDGVCVGLVGL